VPDQIDVHIINRPGKPFLGSGETGQWPAAASIANAIANATGKRLRPFSADTKADQGCDRRVSVGYAFGFDHGKVVTAASRPTKEFCRSS